jgi:hypothetical protein
MVEVSIIVVSGTDRKGNAVFSAEGTIDEREFVAQTIQYKGEPIFKVLENNSHYSLNNSSFSRGDRSRIARACKLARIKKFGEGHKQKVKPDLSTGEVVDIFSVSSKKPSRKRTKYKGPLHPSGLPMNASISALKRQGY